MKIRTKIALRYSIVTAILMIVFAGVVYLISANSRESEFYNNLKKEGISKASLFFEAKASPETMHSIYKNNIEYINEVETAIYNKNNHLLYHDAKDIDIVKETPKLIQEILSSSSPIRFYIGKYQAVGFVFTHKGQKYAITAAAYDGYGYTKIHKLIISLFILCLISTLILWLVGYYLAKRALQPVAEITHKMEEITATHLDKRIKVDNSKDEIGELASTFNETLNILEESFTSQKMFVSNVSHELRTPLASLIGEIDIALLKDRSLQEYKETLNNVKQDTSKLIKLLNNLLDLAKAGYVENQISRSLIRLDEILLDARELILKSNPKYKVHLLFIQDIENEEEITIFGNEYLLKRAFVNLMENNCKFSENQTSNIQISFLSDKINIQFSDSGIGITDKEIDNIFLPFYRGENKQYAQGNGIGLFFVKKVLQLHKTEISINSKKNEGTSFILSFTKR